MSYIADKIKDKKLFDYINGNIYAKPVIYDGIYNSRFCFSISIMRFNFLNNEFYNKDNNFKISLRDIETNKWTKWEKFPGKLFNKGNITAAIDVHRSMMPNEIVIESDYTTYDENYNAAVFIGKILESKGFIPHYYYSGNKSIHVHVFLSNIFLNEISANLRNDFVKWLRSKMISCWDTNAKKFDHDLINATHLIRCELSKNKKGFKTFLGYDYKELPEKPYICNEENQSYPKLGTIYESCPYDIKQLIDEFLENRKTKLAINKSKSKYNYKSLQGEIRDCVKIILDDNFSKVSDGYSRAMFILVSELRRVYSDDKAKEIAIDWNNRMGNKILESEIYYRFKKKPYTLTTKYINEFLSEIGIKV